MMDDQVTPALAQSSAVRAFEDLRGEVSLLRRAIEGLTAERRDQPDYGLTLEAIATSNEEIRAWSRKINERSALQLMPQGIGKQIDAAASQFRQQGQQELVAAQAALASAAAELQAISRHFHSRYEQERRVKLAGDFCFLGGLILPPILSMIEVVWQ